MKKTLVAMSGVLALACGGGGGSGAPAGPSFRDPGQANFTYGAPAPATTEEDNAAASAESNLSDVLTVASGTDPSSAALSLALATTSVGDVFPGGVPSSPSPSPYLVAGSGARQAPVAAARRLLASRMAALDATPVWDNGGCVGGGTGLVTFNHCTTSDSGPDYAQTLSVNGSVTLAAGHLAYDLTIAITDSESTTDGGTFQMTVSERLRADLDYTATTFAGFVRTDLWLSMAEGAQSAAFGVTYNADYALGYLDDPSFCITNGTMTLKRLWIEHPQGQGFDPADFTDAAVQFTWTGGAPAAACSTGVNVAWGTPL